MELNNDFEVGAPIDRAWAILTDVEKIAPCLPGAQLQEVEGEEYRGIVKVKVGPITAQYKGAATFVERDDANHRAVLKADGRDTRGAGNASALITAKLVPAGERTRVDVHTDLTVTGKVAQFGRGVMADVSAKLMAQFADNLEQLIESEGPGATAAPASGVEAGDAVGEVTGGDGNGAGSPAAAPAGIGSSGPRRIEGPEPQAVDLLDTAGTPILKRVAPLLGALVGLVLLRRVVRRRRK